MQLFLRPLDRFQAAPVEGTEGTAGSAFFSPDSQWLGYYGEGQLKKVAVDGGIPATLGEASGLRGASWGPDGKIVFANLEGTLFEISENGSTAEPLLQPEEGEGYYGPHLLPGGEAVLFTLVSESQPNPAIAVARLDTGERRILIEEGEDPHYLPSGHIVFQLGVSLAASSFDLGKLELDGPATPVVEGVRLGSGTGRGNFSVSDDGVLLCVPATSLFLGNARIVWVDRRGAVEPLSDLSRAFVSHPRLSPDGERLAIAIADPSGAASDVWVLDIARGTLSRLTFEPRTFDLRPFWSPDGRRILYSSNRRGAAFDIFSQPADGSGEATPLETGAYRIFTSLSSDGKTAVFRQQSDVGGFNRDIGFLRLDGESEPEMLLETPFNEYGGVLSPGDRWLAYVSDESGSDEIYVRPFPGSGGRQQVSTGGGKEPLWSPDGKELFYRAGDRMMSVPILSSSPELEIARPMVLFEGRFQTGEIGGNPGTNYDVAPDGRFVMIQGDSSVAETSLYVVLNWFEELKRLVPTR